MAKTFLGGIALRRAPSPALTALATRPTRLLLSLAADQEPSVSVGDSVEALSLLAAGGLHAPAVFCPLGGTVTAINDRPDISDRGEPENGGAPVGKTIEVTLDPTSSAEVPEGKGVLPPMEGSLASLSSEELLLKLHLAGVPMPPSTARTPQKMIVAIDGGPDNASRTALAHRHPREIVFGAKILMKYFGVRECLFAVPASCRALANRLQRHITSRPKMQKVILVKDKYPQFEEHLLVSALCNLEIHPTRSTSSLGYPVVSPTLCLAVYRALVEGIPFTEVPITLKKGNRTCLRQVPLGTPLSELPALVGLPVTEREELLHAETICAYKATPDSAVTVDTEALRILPKYQKKVSPLACIGCRRCAGVCPTHLMPMKLYASLRKGSLPETLNACLTCGCCSAVCPSALPLTETFAAALQHPTTGGTIHG